MSTQNIPGVGYQVTNPNTRTASDMRSMTTYAPGNEVYGWARESYMPSSSFGRTVFDLQMNSMYNPSKESYDGMWRPPRTNTFDNPYQPYSSFIQYQPMKD